MRKFITAVLVLLSVPAMAQGTGVPTETVVVQASALAGVWKVAMPENAQSDLIHNTKWGPMQETFCRIEELERGDPTIHCLAMPNSVGTVNVEDGHVHLAWGSMLVRVAIDGKLQSLTHFDGTFGVKGMGIAIDDPDASNGTKLILSGAAPDSAGKSALLSHLLDEMTKGPPAEPFDTQAKVDVQFPKPDTLRSLSAVQKITYLGEAPKYLMKNPKVDTTPTFEDFWSVYDVEFTSGERICGLHQRGDGILDGFRCV